MTTEVTVVIGAGSMGQAIARRIGVGQTVLLADINEDNAKVAATTLTGAGYRTRTAKVDVSSQDSARELADTAARLGAVMHGARRLVHHRLRPAHRRRRHRLDRGRSLPGADGLITAAT
ncbi:MAG: hypothetical protein ABW022_28815 [Actinoplanes sp.]